jgi:hypothetical protein
MANPKGIGGFEKGRSGNPEGRPRKEREERLYEITVSTVPIKRWKKIVLKAVDQAERGDATARKWLSDQLLGVPTQNIEHRTSKEMPFVVQLSWGDNADEGL